MILVETFMRLKNNIEKTRWCLRARQHHIFFDMKTAQCRAEPVYGDDKTFWHMPEYIEKATCPTWDKIIKDAFRLCEDPREMVNHFHEVIGYLIFPSRCASHRFVFYGDSDSGKYEIFNTVADMIDDRRDLITFEKFIPNRIHTDRQLEYTNIIPFYNNYEFPARNTYFFDRVQQKEMSGVLWHIIRGIKRLIKRGGFRINNDIITASKTYFTNVDHIGSFIESKIVLLDDENVTIKIRELWQTYKNWCSHVKKPLTRKNFINELMARGIETNGDYQFKGIALKQY